MNEQRIEELKAALQGVMDMIMQRGTPLTNALKAMLLQVMQFVADRIEDLRSGDVPDLPPPEPPELEPAGYPSAQINAFNYDPDSKQLYVKFQGKYPEENGPVYQYENVPENLFKLFARGAVAPKTSGKNAWHEWKKGIAPSLGASMNALIKEGGFRYSRIS